jgi:hypothetical protein
MKSARLAQWRLLGVELGIGSRAHSRMPPPSEWPSDDDDDHGNADEAEGNGASLSAYLRKRPTD